MPWRQHLLQCGENRPDPVLTSWLVEQGSLTARLRKTADEIEVQLTGLYLRNLGLDDGHRLGLNARSNAMIREVCIYAEGSLCFRAQTLIPQSSLVRGNRRLKGWQNRSLGDYLFREPNPVFSTLEFSHRVIEGEPHWGRRRCHYLYNKPILVCEFFPESSFCQWNL